MINFTNITKSFKSNKILKEVTFSVDTGNLVAIIGESGCGKTTLLKMINRLIKPTSGSISIDGEDILSLDEVSLRRKIGYVIQQTGLFPHMTIKENIEIIPKILKVDSAHITENTKKLMNMVGLDYEDFINRYPTELSGGQQQRVGVARAFANDPDVILMDEPFSALDPMTRSDLQDELVELQFKLKKTIVFVTHDMDEAIKIADKICIMKEGRILQYDTPENILKNPIDEYVSNFVGENRIWSSPEFIKVHDFMMNKPITATKDLSALKCIDKMRQQKVDSLLIINPENRHLQGIVKASQIRAVGDRTQAAENFMVTDFPTLNPDNTIVDALKLVTEQQISTIPVIKEDGYLVGLVTRSNLVTTLSQQYYNGDEEVGV